MAQKLDLATIGMLIKIADRDCFYDDDVEDKIVDDYAGGNVDDAFSLGKSAGETMLARQILRSMGVTWDVE